MKNLSSKKNETIERSLDNEKFDNAKFRGVEAECFKNRFCSKLVPTYYPGYEPEEVDDGRLDPIHKTGFVPDGEIPDTYEAYVTSGDPNEEIPVEESEDSFEPEPSTSVEPVDVDNTFEPHAPSSRRAYRHLWNKVQFIGVIRRGRGVVPYTTGMLQR